MDNYIQKYIHIPILKFWGVTDKEIHLSYLSSDDTSPQDVDHMDYI